MYILTPFNSVGNNIIFYMAHVKKIDLNIFSYHFITIGNDKSIL